ncbi:MAG: hypothetical protein JXA99_10430 [Candidatus Lokiarchaeota archaeon]|nr:hypothetical protein [Candidatus Lokiarchaeota archaeon]
MSDLLQLLIYMKNMFSDIIYINGVIATQLTQIVEKLSVLNDVNNSLKDNKSISEHKELMLNVLEIIKKYKGNTEEFKNLEDQILKNKN